ncbi:FtsK/SpoIIIE domain-containing protein [Cryptosporangium aurantiacum]|uniref:FtsK/SpoIIIE family protein n=1 Tax=Cryptosporangium aurantiacum TaxID=134849 RepID=A0A1M7RQ38_9ACTN|nr:FtsK/SpoIIIE domain-containing protein [Cryptosporangium aurantiacum]SHN48202.1 FtsK/SpoIIIE family protein [Cryptosporangium aurantiacum]
MRHGSLIRAGAWFMIGRWVGRRYARQVATFFRWSWKAFVLFWSFVLVRWGPDAFAGLALVWGVWALTAHSRSPLLVPRWPRWTVPLAWSVLVVGCVAGLQWAPPGWTSWWYWLALVGTTLGALVHRGQTLRAVWRPAGYGLWLTAAFAAAPGRWRLQSVATALGAGLALAVAGWPRLGAYGALVGLALGLRQFAAETRTADALADATTGIATALNGALVDPRSGWDPEAGVAPVEVLAATEPGVDPPRPLVLAAPLPATWQASQLDTLDTEVRARLRRWGEWMTVPDPSERVIEVRAVEPLPRRVGWDGTADLARILVGVARVPHAAATWDADAPVGSITRAIWQPELAPHLLIVGPTGAGKSVAARAVIAQWTTGHDALGRPGEVSLLDPKRVEFLPWRRRPGVLGVATEPDEMLDVLVEAVADMDARYRTMGRLEVQHVDDLPPDLRPGRRMLVLDEAGELLDLEGLEEEEKALRRRMRRELLSLARLGRAAGWHLLLLAQRPDASILGGQLRHNLQARMLCGPAEPPAVRMVYGESASVPAITPGVRGRARWSSVGEPPREVQGVWISTGDMDVRCPRDGAPGSSPPPPGSPLPLAPIPTDAADQWMAGRGIDPIVVVDAPPAEPVVRTI